MEVLKKGNGYKLKFKCWTCMSTLLADQSELTTRLGDEQFRFTCPVCNEERKQFWDNTEKVES